MNFLDKLLIKLFCKYAGSDDFGNRYYTSYFSKDYLGRRRRYVVYKGTNEPSKVPASWHAWLHHLEDEALDSRGYAWEQMHMPNLTGTRFAYNTKTNSRPRVSADYDAWFPWREK